jgi:hypothetical protein
MGRRAKAYWVKPRAGRAGHWITQGFGEYSEVTGRRKPVRNYAIGPPEGKGAEANRLEAQRWLEGLATAADRPSATSAADVARRAAAAWTWRRRTGAAEGGQALQRRAVLALAAMGSATPTVEELAHALGLDLATLSPSLRQLEIRNHIERWWSPLNCEVVMLSARSVDRLGLELAPDGRWRPAR